MSVSDREAERPPGRTGVMVLAGLCLAVVAASLLGLVMPSGAPLVVAVVALAGYAAAHRLEWLLPASGEGVAPIIPPLAVLAVAVPAPAAALSTLVVGFVADAVLYRQWPSHRVVVSKAAWALGVLVAAGAVDVVDDVGWLAGAVGDTVDAAVVVVVLMWVPWRVIRTARSFSGAPATIGPWQAQFAVVSFPAALLVHRGLGVDGYAAVAAALVVIATLPLQQHVLATVLRAQRAEAEQRRVAGMVLRLDDMARLEVADSVHAGALQRLAIANMCLGMCEATDPMAERAAGEVRRAADDLRELIAGYGDGAEEVSRSGLAAALRAYVRSHHPDAVDRVELVVDLGEVSGDVVVQAYRIVVEALGNALRYADASRVRVEVVLADPDVDGDAVVVSVSDDGVGFDRAELAARSDRQHLGLVLMSTRATGVGGRLDIDTAPGRGTTVRAVLPVAGVEIPPSLVEFGPTGLRFGRRRR